MSLRWVEGFEVDRNTTYHDRRYAFRAGMSNFLTGRLQGYCLGASSTTEFRPVSFGVGNTWTIGFGLQHYGSTSDLSDAYISFKRGALENLRLQFVQDTSSTFKFQIKRGSTVLATSAAYEVNRWHYFELQVVIHPSTGSYELRHNEVLDTSDSSVNTADSGTAGADTIDYQLRYTGLYMDDMYILDDAGSVNNDFLGDCVVEGRLPTGDGVTSDWTPSSGVNHFALLDDPATTPSDTDYVSSASVSDIDLLTFDNLSFITGQVYGVFVAATARLDATGSRTMRAKARSGGTTYDGSQTWTINSTSWQTFVEIFEVDPATSSLWAIADVDAAEFGFEVVS